MKKLFSRIILQHILYYLLLLFLIPAVQAELPEKPVYTPEFYKLTGQSPDETKPEYKSENNTKNSPEITPTIKPERKPAKRAVQRRNRILTVGPGKEFSLPSEAAKTAIDGDMIEIYADGDYLGDEAVWKQNNITIKGVAGRPHIKGENLLKNRKALWVIAGDKVLIENIEFSNARVQDKNGAAIRNSGDYLRLVNCYIHHNENGILTGSGKNAVVEIKGSEFSYNGFGKGRTHNIYVGRVARFSLINSYIHHAIIGHNVKTRANKNFISYNKIIDGEDGQSSYAIDISEGGKSYLIGNVIQQGKKTENYSIVAYAAENFRTSDRELYLVNNTIINDRRSGIFVNARQESQVHLINNIFYGDGKVSTVPYRSIANLVIKNNDLFVDVKNFDYRPKQTKLIIDKGVEPGQAGDVKLAPVYQYIHPLKLGSRKINRKIDIGAFEYSNSD